MISPKLVVTGNDATLKMYTRFGELKTYDFYKPDEDYEFRLSYIAVSEIVTFKAIVKEVCPSHVVLQKEGGTTRMNSLYGENLEVGQLVNVVEYFPLYTKNESSFMAITNWHRDFNCICVNVNLLRNRQVIRQFKIDPFTGDGIWR